VQETTAVECADVGNTITFDASRKHWPYRMLRPIAFSDDAGSLSAFEAISGLEQRSFTNTITNIISSIVSSPKALAM
jgi:hypothetical protein